MRQTASPSEFDAFVAARSRSLLNAAWLLTGDRQLAEDLLQTALAKAYLAWRRIGAGGEEAYVRKILFTTYVTWWRRAAFRERPAAVADPVDAVEPSDLQGDAVVRDVVR
ncbi:MAG: SigE family RNA polymerase sigma factor, partial [Nocardioidaceae bacterium]